VAAVAERSLEADLTVVARPIAAVVEAAGPMVGAAVAAVVGAVVRRIVGVRVVRRDCTASAGLGCIERTVSFGIGGLGLGHRRTGRIRGEGEEVAGIRWRGRHRTIVEETCRAVDLMLWSWGSAV
jgi:hypothetical protein